MSKAAIHFAINLPLVFLKERRTHIAYSPALDLSASGTTPQKAKENFQKVLRLFIGELVEHGTLPDVLKEKETAMRLRSRQWVSMEKVHAEARKAA